MPKKLTPRQDQSYRLALSWLQEDVTKLVFDHELANFKDEYQSLFHEVYSRCTHHIDLATIGEQVTNNRSVYVMKCLLRLFSKIVNVWDCFTVFRTFVGLIGDAWLL